MLKKIVNIRLSAANWLILSFLTVLATACSISYKFNGASIDYTKVKTITIRDFTNQAPYVNPTLCAAVYGGFEGYLHPSDSSATGSEQWRP